MAKGRDMAGQTIRRRGPIVGDRALALVAAIVLMAFAAAVLAIEPARDRPGDRAACGATVTPSTTTGIAR